MLFLPSFYGISLGFQWDFHDMSMIFFGGLLWDYYWIIQSMRSKLKSVEGKLKSIESKLKSFESGRL